MSLAQALPEAVRSAVCAVLTVSGFVVTFSVVTGMLDASGLLPALVGTLSARLGLELHFARALCTGVLELGTGIGAMQGLAPTPGNLALAAFLIGWGGVSVHCPTHGRAPAARSDLRAVYVGSGKLGTFFLIVAAKKRRVRNPTEHILRKYKLISSYKCQNIQLKSCPLLPLAHGIL